LTRKKVQKKRNFCFKNCFVLIFNDLKSFYLNLNNKNLLMELKNRIFARSFSPSILNERIVVARVCLSLQWL